MQNNQGNSGRRVGVIQWSLLLGLLLGSQAFSQFPPDDTSSPGASPAASTSNASDVLNTITVTEVDGQAVQPSQSVTAGSSADFYVTVEPHRPDAKVYLAVHSFGSERVRLHGPGKPESPLGTYLFSSVNLGDGIDLGRRFVVRAAMVTGGGSLTVDTTEALSGAAAKLSAPVFVRVDERPQAPTGFDRATLVITTINGRTVEPDTGRGSGLVVPGRGDVAGTLFIPQPAGRNSAAPAAGNGRTPPNAPAERRQSEGSTPAVDSDPGFIHILLRGAGSERWRVEGRPARLEPGAASTRGRLYRWTARDVRLDYPGQPQYVHLEILAVGVRRPLPPGPIDRSSWTGPQDLSSPRVVVTLAAASTNVDVLRVPVVAIDKVGQNKLTAATAATAAVAPGGTDIEGTVARLSEGMEISLAVHHPGVDRWFCLPGSAQILDIERVPPGSPAGDVRFRWILPRVRFDLGGFTGDRATVAAVVSRQALPTGPLTFSDLRSRIVGMSRTLSLVLPPRSNDTSITEAEIVLQSVGAQAVNDSAAVRVAAEGDIRGAVSGLPAGALVYTALREEGGDLWRLLGPAIVRDETFLIPGARLEGAGSRLDGAPSGSRRLDLLALVAYTQLPASSGGMDVWQPYTLAISPIVRILPGSTTEASPMNPVSTSALGGGSIPSGWIILGILLVLLLLIGLLAKRSPRKSGTLAGAMARDLVSIDRKLRDCFIDSLIGIAALVAAAILYQHLYPMYAYILRSALSIPGSVARDMALYLMMATGAVGVSIDLILRWSDGYPRRSYEKDGSEPEGADERGRTLFFNLAWVLGLTFCVVIFIQAFIYANFLGRWTQAAIVNGRSVMFGVAGGFFMFIEAVLIWLATHSLFPSITVWPVHMAERMLTLYQTACLGGEGSIAITHLDARPVKSGLLLAGDQPVLEGTAIDIDAQLPLVLQVHGPDGKSDLIQCTRTGEQWRVTADLTKWHAGEDCSMRVVAQLGEVGSNGKSRVISKSQEIHVAKRPQSQATPPVGSIPVNQQN